MKVEDEMCEEVKQVIPGNANISIYEIMKKAALTEKDEKELKEYTKDATSMIVAQRIGTIINADKIIVLDKGRCVGQGTHKELLKNCEVYKEIALSQLSEEELASA